MWIITTPVLLLLLLLGTGLPLSDIATVLFMAVVWIATWLLGALVSSSYKWGFFAMGLAALIYILSILWGGGRTSAFSLGSNAGRAYRGSSVYLGLLWLLYPICWGLSEGGNVISPTGEMVFYGSKSFCHI